jgi:hypothetical protein
MLKRFLGDAMDHWGSLNIPLLLFFEIIPLEESTLNKPLLGRGSIFTCG